MRLTHGGLQGPGYREAGSGGSAVHHGATLRWWIFHAETNGLKPALLKIGGRVYIDRAEFNKWLEGQRMAPKPLKPAA
jgi:hypothetical protein